MASIYKRGETYWGRVRRQGQELRQSLRTRDRRVAERRLRKWIGDLDGMAFGEQPDRLLTEAIARFAREHLPTLKPASRRRYASSIRMMLPHLEGLTLPEVNRAALNRLETARRTVGASAPTVRRDLACLSSVFSMCEEWEWTADGSNPVPAYLRRGQKRGLKESPPRERYLSEGEEAALLAAFTDSAGDAAAVAIDTGLRLEEQFSLRWSQVDLQAGVIRTGTGTKSGRSRAVPLSHRTRAVLARLPRSIAHDYVFFDPKTGCRYRDRKTALRGAVRRSGIPHLTWHDLRRTAGCRWLQRDGMSLHEVSALLGHSSVQVTERHYAFLNVEDVARRAGKHKNRNTTRG